MNSTSCKYYTERTLGWMLNNKMIVFLATLSFCLFVSTLALAGQRNRLAAEIDNLKTSTIEPPTTPEKTTTVVSITEALLNETNDLTTTEATTTDVTTTEASSTVAPSSTPEDTNKDTENDSDEDKDTEDDGDKDKDTENDTDEDKTAIARDDKVGVKEKENSILMKLMKDVAQSSMVA